MPARPLHQPPCPFGVPWALLLTACAPLATPEVLIPPDAARTGADGTEGPFGAAVTGFDMQVRVRDARHVDVVHPALDDGSPDLSGAPYPTLVFLHGGFVGEERYRWLGAHLATRGIVTIAPHHELELAILEPGNGTAALAAVRARADGGDLDGLVDEGTVIVGGHSLGGVLAARQWLEDADVDGLILMASEPAPGDPVEDGTPRPVLSLTGAEDGRITPDEVRAGARRFPGSPYVGVVDGMNHFDWTSDATPGELASDGASTRPLSEIRRDALRVIDAFADQVLVDEDLGPFTGTFPGVQAVTP